MICNNLNKLVEYTMFGVVLPSASLQASALLSIIRIYIEYIYEYFLDYLPGEVLLRSVDAIDFRSEVSEAKLHKLLSYIGAENSPCDVVFKIRLETNSLCYESGGYCEKYSLDHYISIYSLKIDGMQKKIFWLPVMIEGWEDHKITMILVNH